MMLPVKYYLFLLILCSSVPVVADNSDELPSLAMLEFLAEWSAEDQAWLDQETMKKPMRNATQVEVEDE